MRPVLRGPPPAVSEKLLQQGIVQVARLLGYMVYHTHDSRGSEPGFPDLCLVRGSRLIFAELKSAGGRVKPAQRTWLDALKATGAEAYIWRPADWFDGTIDGVLAE